MEEKKYLRNKVRELEDRLFATQEQVRELRSQLYSSLVWDKTVVDLTPTEEAVLNCFLKRTRATQETIRRSIYGAYGDFPDRWKENITVHISKLRRKLSPYGIKFNNHNSRGYFVTKEDQEKLIKISQGVDIINGHTNEALTNEIAVI